MGLDKDSFCDIVDYGPVWHRLIRENKGADDSFEKFCRGVVRERERSEVKRLYHCQLWSIIQ